MSKSEWDQAPWDADTITAQLEFGSRDGRHLNCDVRKFRDGSGYGWDCTGGATPGDYDGPEVSVVIIGKPCASQRDAKAAAEAAIPVVRAMLDAAGVVRKEQT